MTGFAMNYVEECDSLGIFTWEESMKYLSTWVYDPSCVEAITERFMQTGGKAPEGVTMLGRWFDVAGGRGYALSESTDPIAMAKWTREWSDLMSFEVTPVLDDEQMVQLLQG